MDCSPQPTVTLRRLGLADAPRLDEMYRSCEIGTHNYREKLTPGEKSFENIGGMFLINSPERNRELLTGSGVMIGGELDGKLSGMIWYDTADCAYPFDEIRYTDETASYRDTVTTLAAEHRVFPGKEVIVMPEAKGQMAYELFAALLSAGGEAGYTHMIGEVYCADGYEDGDGFFPCHMLNIPSFRTLQKTGGIHLGTLPQKIISKDPVRYYITPQVFLWNISESVSTIRQIITLKWG